MRWARKAGVADFVAFAALCASVLCASAFVYLIVSQQPAIRPEYAQPAEPSPALQLHETDFVTVTTRRMPERLALPGNVHAVSQAVVRARVAGEVLRIRVREGDRVEAGDIVAELDTTHLMAVLAEKTAALASARAQLAQAERTRQSHAQLLAREFISRAAFDAVDASFRTHVAAVELAAAQRTQAEILLKDATVVSPISGEVARRHVHPGEQVSPDAPLLSVVDPAKLEVVAQLPVTDVARISRGQSVAVEIDGIAERVFQGRVDRVNPSADSSTRMIQLYVELADHAQIVKAGMYARVLLEVPDRQATAVLPPSAIAADGLRHYVWVLTNGRLRQRDIIPGRRELEGRWVEVRSGLEPGDKVLAAHTEHLQEGRAAFLSAASSAAAPETVTGIRDGD